MTDNSEEKIKPTKESELVSLSDVLAKATDAEGNGIITEVKHFGKMKFKMLTPSLGSMLEKRAMQMVNGKLEIDMKELSIFIADACLINPRIPEDQLRKFGFGYLNEIVVAVNRISGMATTKQQQDAQADF